MIHLVRAFRGGVTGTLALLVAGAMSASAQTPAASPGAMAPAAMAPADHMPAPPGPPAGRAWKLSDTIQTFNGQCRIQSEADDKDPRPEPKGGVKCVFKGKLNGFFQVTVPNDPDETIVCSCKVYPGKPPTATIRGTGREGQGPGAYSVVITGSSYGTSVILRVWEPPNAP
jgi:hypothetical protein